MHLPGSESMKVSGVMKVSGSKPASEVMSLSGVKSKFCYFYTVLAEHLSDGISEFVTQCVWSFPMYQGRSRHRGDEGIGGGVCIRSDESR